MLPSWQLLEKVRKKIMSVPNRRKETKREIHYGLFLLGYKSGLRINEAVKFDLSNKTRRGLYKISKCKGKKERLVYIPKKVIRELKKSNWKPNQTNRWNFYHFLRKIKRELNISPKIELTPHTLRRAFTTYHAENGLPLPLLQKLLGHSSIRTTALYWRNIYGDDEIGDILAGKKWLETTPDNSLPEKEPPKTPTTENLPEQLPENLEPNIRNKPVITSDKSGNKDNSLLTTKAEKNPAIANYQPKVEISGIPTKSQEKFFLNTREQLPVITNKREQSTEKELLLTKIRQLEKELAKVQAENTNLKAENKHLKALIRKDQETEAKVIQTFKK
ncbi:MAG: tyrosine-type recombinase/integrase [Candidatus Moeniiplasma glomeromycotorum]|nr:tyrosine-type recombinase/integrase [Candidatus Moeniiplasma glomeromycotorum]